MLLFIVGCRHWLFLERLVIQGRLGIGFKEPDSYLKLENRTDYDEGWIRFRFTCHIAGQAKRKTRCPKFKA